jgi:hypothetical protein
LILKEVFSQFPSLNPEWLDFTNELHATKDRTIFLEKSDLWTIPLYKGEMIRAYQNMTGPTKYFLDTAVFDRYLLEKEIFKLKKDLTDQWPSLSSQGVKGPLRWPFICDLLSVRNPDDLGQFVRPGRNYPRLGYRAIARDTNERTMVAALLPPQVGAQNSLWVSRAGRYFLDLPRKTIGFQPITIKKLLFTAAIFNSLTIDFVLRAMVNLNVNKTYVLRLPLPQPSEEDMAENPLYREVIRSAALMTLFNNKDLFSFLMGEFNFKPADLIPSQEDFDRCKAILDVKIARLYGLEPRLLVYFLESFKVLNRTQPQFVAFVRQLAESAG